MDRGRTLRALTAAGLVAVLGGCSLLGDVRRPVPTPPARPPGPVGPPGLEIRQVEVPVPTDFSLHTVEFVDQTRGYVLFTRCGLRLDDSSTSCAAIVLTTDDGGRSWTELPHPHPDAANHRLYAVDTRLALLADPYGWWVSLDAGGTLTHLPGGRELPATYRSLLGRYQVDRGRLVLVVAAAVTPLAAQPPVRRLATVAEDPNRLYAAGLDDGRPSAAVSPDDGRTWQPTAVPPPPRRVVGLRLLTSVGHDADAWLIGDTARTDFPVIWRFDGTAWRTVAATGHPERYLSVAPAGEGALVFSGPSGSGVVADDTYRVSDWPVAHAALRRLADGTLLGRVGEEVYLGIGTGLQRRWIGLRLTKL